MNPREDVFTIWPAKYSYYGIGAAILVTFIIVAYFGLQAIAPHWLIINLVAVVLYFVVINIVSARSVKSSDQRFARNLFWFAWISRLLFMVIIVMVAEVTWDRPFYVGAVDALRYHRVATQVAEIIHAGAFSNIFPHLMLEYGFIDNIGVPLVLGPVYALFGASPIVGKLFFTLMGSGTVLLAYKTARLIWDESTARLAGIMLAFFPLALFYSSVLLKEEFVVFLSLLGIYVITKSVQRNKISIRDFALLLFAMVFLFFFRTAAGALLAAVVVGTLVLNRFGGNIIYSLFVSGLVFLVFTFFLDLFGELDHYINRVTGFTGHSEQRLRNIASGNPLATIVGIPAYIVLSFFAPFPHMVFTPLRFDVGHDFSYYIICGVMIWNFIIFFGLTGLWKSLRSNISESFPVWAFAFGYTIILGLTAMFTSERFAYNAMPSFFILIAVGIKYRREFPYWQLYLCFAILLIFAWNVFRLAGRGMV